MKGSKDVRLKLHNRFDIEVYDTRNNQIRQKAQAENIILDSLWSSIFSSTDWPAWFGAIHYGTGTGILSAARTSLFSFAGAKSAGGSVFTSNIEGYASLRKSIQLIETDNVGAVLSEVGIGSNTSSGYLRTHALLKDMNGNSVTIEKTAFDIVTIYASVYLMFPEDGVFDSGKIMSYVPGPNLLFNYLYASILGESVAEYSLTYIRFYERAGMPAAECGTTSMNPYQTLKSYCAQPTITNSLATKTKSYYLRCPAASANGSSGLKSVTLSCTKSLLSPLNYSHVVVAADLLDSSAFSGSTITGEQIGVGDDVTSDFKTNFALVRPGAKVYVDGIEQTSGVTVDYNEPNDNELTSYLRILDFDASGFSGTLNTYDLCYPGINRDWSGNGIPCIFENPFYATHGIYSVYIAGAESLYCSDDMETWVEAVPTGSTGQRSVNSLHRNKRYWRCSGARRILYNFLTQGHDGNVHFSTPPSEDAVITIDYDTPVVGKDASHVFDFTFNIQLGEYTEEY